MDQTTNPKKSVQGSGAARLGRLRIAGYECLRCGHVFAADLELDSRGCPSCFATAPANVVVASAAASSAAVARAIRPSLWRFSNALPCDEEDAVSLGEGLTPLVAASRLGERLGLTALMIKDEGTNPTWSHKDRFSTVAVSVARLQGAKVVATASSGNAGASLAAYAARAGLRCVVATFQGTSDAMVQQIRKYGASVVQMAKKTDRWALLAQGRERYGWCVMSPFSAPVVGSHPIGIEGYKTLAFEIVEQMNGEPPNWCALPVCYGDALIGLWRGFEELKRAGTIRQAPRLLAAEVHGSLGRALVKGTDTLEEALPDFDTLAVSIGATRSTYQALKALRDSNGLAETVANDELVDMQERLASQEGILAELASVAPLVAIARLRRKGVIGPDDKVVAVATGSGLKDLHLSRAKLANERVFETPAEALEVLGDDAATSLEATEPTA
jgi:threonine synthase